MMVFDVVEASERLIKEVSDRLDVDFEEAGDRVRASIAVIEAERKGVFKREKDVR